MGKSFNISQVNTGQTPRVTPGRARVSLCGRARTGSFGHMGTQNGGRQYANSCVTCLAGGFYGGVSAFWGGLLLTSDTEWASPHVGIQSPRS